MKRQPVNLNEDDVKSAMVDSMAIAERWLDKDYPAMELEKLMKLCVDRMLQERIKRKLAEKANESKIIV